MVVMTRPGDGAAGLALWLAIGGVVAWIFFEMFPRWLNTSDGRRLILESLCGSGHIRAQLLLPMRYLIIKSISHQIS
jgi:hypothetical protein